MIFTRRRYYFWLFRAYIKKWKKTIVSSLIIGVFVCIAIIEFVTFYLIPTVSHGTKKIGYVGIYTPDTLPQSILSYMSYGLTSIDENESINPAAADHWEIKNNGKEYIFSLRRGIHFQNGDELTSANVLANFKDVKRRNINPYTIDFQLKNPYAPFLVSVDKPLFINNFIGLGNYKLQKLDINAGFVKSIILQKTTDSRVHKNIYFYPTQDSVKLAFALGDVNEIDGLDSLTFQGSNFSKWRNVSIKKTVKYSELITLFYNNTDSYLSDKKLRQALNYALPETFPNGERAYSPISPQSPFYVHNPDYTLSSIELSKTELSGIKDLPKKPIEISTTQDFLNTAKTIQKVWKQVGILSTIKVVEGIPSSFQVFLYKFHENSDPDQYSLWHSDGTNNIANYKKNLRIDKLLEDGRQTTDATARVKIYADFQKYLLDDVPASFLYFPYEYTLMRK